MKYTLGEMIDKLSITNTKIYHCVMKAHQEEDENKSLKLFKKSFDMNKERVRIINEIDKFFGDVKKEKIKDEKSY